MTTPRVSTEPRPPWPPVGPSHVPLVVDLDGTLTLADSLEWLRASSGRDPEVERGRVEARAESKQAEKVYLWEHVPLDWDVVPFDDEVLTTLAQVRDSGRRLMLVTGSAQGLAEDVAARLGLFDEAIGSDPDVNRTGPRKAAGLVERFGERGFDYIGDSAADLPVWAAARHGYFLSRPTTVAFEVPDDVLRVERDLGLVPPPVTR